MKNIKSIIATSLSIIALTLATDLKAQKKTSVKKQSIKTEISDKKWIPKELLGEKVVIAPDSRSNLSLEFSKKDKTYVAHTDCNTLAGSYTLGKSNKLKTGQGISSAMACKDAKYEGLMNRALTNVDHYTVKNKTLVLLDAKNKILGSFTLAN